MVFHAHKISYEGVKIAHPLEAFSSHLLGGYAFKKFNRPDPPPSNYSHESHDILFLGPPNNAGEAYNTTKTSTESNSTDIQNT